MRWFAAAAFSSLLAVAPVASGDEAGNRVMIAPDLYSFTVTHEGEAYEILRNQTPGHRINALYDTTGRGVPQPMHPFEPHQVETLGELEFIRYMQQAQTDSNVMIVDTRTVGWFARLTIPGAQSYPYTMMDDAGDRDWALDDFGVTKTAAGEYDFSQAKTLAMFCNGYWCAQTPAMIRKLLALGYPDSKLKYYRGGMQAWVSLGFSVVGEGAE
ncbi:rhodanese-like domain-containing protein [Marinobacterium sp. 3-1745]|uniref:Rhodanese-like domain-containing protein n=2 Tax=Marinobacterium marinum TaxID=2756129 RepID=A0A7W1WXB7_9GAMM|nr:rhodanese-like domain-containing protein [Marinobacterium marinum]